MRVAETGFVLSRDGKTLASQLGLWDVPGRKRIPVVGHPGEIDYVAVSPAGDAVVSAGGGTVIIWDAAGKERRRFGPGITMTPNSRPGSRAGGADELFQRWVIELLHHPKWCAQRRTTNAKSPHTAPTI